LTIEKIFEHLDEREDSESFRKIQKLLESNTTINVCTKHAKRTDNSYSYGQAPAKTNDNVAMSPFQYAMAKGKWLCAKFLLEQDCRALAILPEEFSTPLHEIARCDDQEFLFWFWNEPANTAFMLTMSAEKINCRNEEHLTPFMLAIKSQKDLERITVWGNFHNNDYSAVDNKDRNIVHIAIEARHSALIPMLLGLNNALASMHTHTGAYPLHMAAMTNNLVAMQSLCEAGAKVNVTDKDYSSPLHWAAKWGHIEAMKFLLQQGAKVNTANWDRDTAAHVVIKNHLSYVSNNEEKKLQAALTLLLEYGADFHIKNKRSHNVFETASENIESNEAKKLEFYWAVEHYAERTPTPEMIAAVVNHLEKQTQDQPQQRNNVTRYWSSSQTSSTNSFQPMQKNNK